MSSNRKNYDKNRIKKKQRPAEHRTGYNLDDWTEEENFDEEKFGKYTADALRNFSTKSDPQENKSLIESFTGKPDKEEERDTYFDRYGKANTKKKPAKKREDKQRDDFAKKPEKVGNLSAKQHRIRNTFAYIGIFFAIMIVSVVLTVSLVFKTEKIVVEGDIPYSQEAVITTSGLGYGVNIFLAPRKAAAKNIVTEFPYIESAEVTFRIPSTLVIKTEPAIPSYEVAANGGYIVVSANGRVLEQSENATTAYPLLKGVKVTDTQVGKYIKFEKESTRQILDEVIDNINENEVPNIYGIDISNAANIKLNYDNRITIALGLPEDVGYKLRTAMVIINSKLEPTDKGDLDVSLANSSRKASYFTPIYSNTITIEDNTTSSDTVKVE